MDVSIIDVTAEHEEAYRSFCDRTTNLLIYYTWQFRCFVAELLRCKPVYKAAIDGSGRIQGILPLMEIEGRYGRVVNSLPFFGSNGGVIAENEKAETLLWQSYLQLLKQPGLASSTVIGNPLVKVSAPIPCDFRDSRIGQITVLDLAGDSEGALMRKLDPVARRNVRKAQKSGVEVGINNLALQELATIHYENMRAIGGRVKPMAFFDELPRYLCPGKDWNLYVADHRGSIVACLLLFYSGNTVDYYIPATRHEDRSIQPSAALLFRAMLDAYARGCTIWNWGGTWISQEGVLRFKRKWGAIDRPYDYHITVGDHSLLSLDADALVDAYGYFYTIPFSKLKSA